MAQFPLSLTTVNAGYFASADLVVGAGVPGVISVGATGGNTAALVFTPGASALSHAVEYETPAGAGNWASAAGSFSGNTFNGTGYNPAQSLQYRIRAINNDGPSAWVLSGSFATDNTGSGTVEIPSAAVGAPVFIQQPVAQSAVEGSQATFSALLTGNPFPSFQWYSSTDGGGNWFAILGANSSTYSRTAVLADSGMLFRLVASNGILPDATSNDVALTVTSVVVPPAITQHPASQTAVVGSNVTFQSAATGVPTPTPQWRKNGVNIPGANSGSLTFTANLLDNTAQYDCVWAGSETTVSNSATLTVTTLPVAPSITVHPVSTTVVEGYPLNLSVTAIGAAPLTYQWQRSNNQGATWSDVSGATGSSYQIPQVALTDTGAYLRVVVSNGVSPAAVSQHAEVTVTNAGTDSPFATRHVVFIPTADGPRNQLRLVRSRGDTHADIFVIKAGDTNAPVDLTGCTLLMTVDPSIDPTGSSTNIFQLVGVMPDPTNGEVLFAPSAQQSDVIGSFYLDIQITDPLGKKRTLVYGSYVLVQDITK